jgi:hypothetical protein
MKKKLRKTMIRKGWKDISFSFCGKDEGLHATAATQHVANLSYAAHSFSFRFFFILFCSPLLFWARSLRDDCFTDGWPKPDFV